MARPIPREAPVTMAARSGMGLVSLAAGSEGSRSLFNPAASLLVHSRTMSTVTAPPDAPETSERPDLAAAGPVEPTTPLRLPPGRSGSRLTQSLVFVRDPLRYNLASRARFGDVWEIKLLSRRDPFVVTAHPDHVQSLLKAKPDDAPSLTGESPLRPILGPNSVLTSVGARHMRQRKLLLPPFHGEAVQRYVEMITDVAEREIDGWRTGEELRLASRMQAVTLKVIMAGIFGIEGTPAAGTLEHRFYRTVRRLTAVSTNPLWRFVELRNIGR